MTSRPGSQGPGWAERRLDTPWAIRVLCGEVTQDGTAVWLDGTSVHVSCPVALPREEPQRGWLTAPGSARQVAVRLDITAVVKPGATSDGLWLLRANWRPDLPADGAWVRSRVAEATGLVDLGESSSSVSSRSTRRSSTSSRARSRARRRGESSTPPSLSISRSGRQERQPADAVFSPAAPGRPASLMVRFQDGRQLEACTEVGEHAFRMKLLLADPPPAGTPLHVLVHVPGGQSLQVRAQVVESAGRRVTLQSGTTLPADLAVLRLAMAG